MTTIIGIIGVILGVLGARYYDYKKYGKNLYELQERIGRQDYMIGVYDDENRKLKKKLPKRKATNTSNIK